MGCELRASTKVDCMSTEVVEPALVEYAVKVVLPGVERRNGPVYATAPGVLEAPERE